jgi:hypothetical protein
MLSEVELPLAEAQRVESIPIQDKAPDPALAGWERDPSTWFFFAGEEQRALRMTICVEGYADRRDI